MLPRMCAVSWRSPPTWTRASAQAIETRTGPITGGRATAGADGVIVRFMLASYVNDTYLVSCGADGAVVEVARFNTELGRLKQGPCPTPSADSPAAPSGTRSMSPMTMCCRRAWR